MDSPIKPHTVDSDIDFVKNQAGHDQEKRRKYQTVEHLIKPILVCLSIFGLYSNRRQLSEKSWYRGPLKVYTCFTLLILCSAFYNINFVRGTIRHVEFGPGFAIVIMDVLYYMLNILSAIVLFVSCCRKYGLPHILNTWHFTAGSSNARFETRLRKVVYGSLVFAVSFICLTTIVSGILFSKNQELDSTRKVMFMLWCVLVEIIHGGCSTLTSSLIVSISFVLYFEFNALRKEFKNEISSDGTFLGDLGMYRKRHQSFCHKVKRFDDMFCSLLGFGLLGNTVIILLSVYVGVWHPEYTTDPQLLMIMIHWTILSVIIVSVICMCGEIVNSSAHRLVSVVYDVNVSKHYKTAAEVQVFLSRLTGEGIGLTAMQMFPINKTTILTVLGLLVTYYLVLVQFHSANNPSDDCPRNCSLHC